METLNHETSFVLSCTCSKPDKEQCSRILNASNKIINWNKVYEIALNQRVLPLLYINIKNILHARVPEEAMNKFKNAFISITTRSLYLSSFLLKTIELFEKNSINALPIKGPIMAQDLYGDICLRAFSDLDILVDENDVGKAWAILLKNKFQPELNLSIKQFRKFIKHEDHFSFFKNTGSINIELHSELSGFYLSKPLRMKHVKSDLKKIRIMNKELSNLSVENLLIYLCIHGAKHGWKYLEQVFCVAEIIRKKEINWKIVNKTVTKWQCKRMFGLGLYLAWKILDAPVADSTVNEIEKDKRIPILAHEVIAYMFKNPLDHSQKDITNRFSSFHIKIRDSFSDKLKYFLRLIFCPTNKEWFNFPLPAWLSFLHYFLRPYRLIVSGLRNKNA